MASQAQLKVIKVDKSNLADLKNACDDALKEYLETKGGYKQSHKHTDIKLLLGYVGCGFAAAGSYYGYIHPFEEPGTKFWTGVSVGLYYLFNILMMGYTYLIEKDIVFTGSKQTPLGTQTLNVSSFVDRYNPYYEVQFGMSVSGSSGSSGSSSSSSSQRDNKGKGPKQVGKTVQAQKFSTALTSWFDVDGVLATEVFEADMANFLANTEAIHLE